MDARITAGVKEEKSCLDTLDAAENGDVMDDGAEDNGGEGGNLKKKTGRPFSVWG